MAYTIEKFSRPNEIYRNTDISTYKIVENLASILNFEI